MAPGRQRMAYVEWIDSMRTDGWKEPREVDELANGRDELQCWSVGLLIDETPDRIVIATSSNPEGGALSPLAIPRCAITRMKQKTVASVFGPARKEAR